MVIVLGYGFTLDNKTKFIIIPPFETDTRDNKYNLEASHNTHYYHDHKFIYIYIYFNTDILISCSHPKI